MSSSPIGSQRTELPLDAFDLSPISLLRHYPGLLNQLVCTLTFSEVVSTNSVEKLNPHFCVLKNIDRYVFGFIHLIVLSYRPYHSSLFTIRFICFFPAALFLIFCLPVSFCTLTQQLANSA